MPYYLPFNLYIYFLLKYRCTILYVTGIQYSDMIFKGYILFRCFSGGTVVKNSPTHAGDPRDAGSIPGSGKSPGEGNGNPLQYSCLGNPIDRGASGLQSMWSQESDMTE